MELWSIEYFVDAGDAYVGRTFNELVQVKYEQQKEEKVLDMVAAREPVAYGRDQSNDHRQI